MLWIALSPPLTKPRGGQSLPRLLLVKPGRTFDELLDRCLWLKRIGHGDADGEAVAGAVEAEAHRRLDVEAFRQPRGEPELEAE